MPVRNRDLAEAADLLSSVTNHITAVISVIESRIRDAVDVPLNVADEADLAATILSKQNDRLLQLLPLLRQSIVETKGKAGARIGEPERA